MSSGAAESFDRRLDEPIWLPVAADGKACLIVHGPPLIARLQRLDPA